MSSGLRRTSRKAGSTTMARVSTPNTIQVLRHPTSTKSHTATSGMPALAMPFPMLAMEMARPRF